MTRLRLFFVSYLLLLYLSRFQELNGFITGNSVSRKIRWLIFNLLKSSMHRKRLCFVEGFYWIFILWRCCAVAVSMKCILAWISITFLLLMQLVNYYAIFKHCFFNNQINFSTIEIVPLLGTLQCLWFELLLHLDFSWWMHRAVK